MIHFIWIQTLYLNKWICQGKMLNFLWKFWFDLCMWTCSLHTIRESWASGSGSWQQSYYCLYKVSTNLDLLANMGFSIRMVLVELYMINLDCELWKINKIEWFGAEKQHNWTPNPRIWTGQFIEIRFWSGLNSHIAVLESPNP